MLKDNLTKSLYFQPTSSIYADYGNSGKQQNNTPLIVDIIIEEEFIQDK